MARASEWSERVKDWRQSGLTARAYAKERGWSWQSLRYWSSELGKRQRLPAGAPSPRAPRMVRVRATERRESAGFTLRVNGAELDVRSGFDAGLLREVLSALREVD